MADMTLFNISGGVWQEAGTIVPAAAEQTVVTGKDNRLALRVDNGNATAVTVRLKAGEGPRSPLGDNDVVVSGNSTAYIALYDTARYMKKTEVPMEESRTIKTVGKVTVVLMQGTGDMATELGETEIGLVKIEAVQL